MPKKTEKVEDSPLRKTLKKTFLGETKKWTVVAGAIALGGMFLAFLHYPLVYSVKTNWISDLGNVFWNPIGAKFFNFGLIISGIVLFFIFIRANQKLVFGIGVIMSFALIGVGYCPENFPTLHMTFSSIFFTCAFLCITILNILNVYSTKGLLYYGLFVTFYNFYFITNVTPFTEWLLFGFDFLFIFVMAYNSYGFEPDVQVNKLF